MSNSKNISIMYKLLSYHMDCDSSYMFSHAIIAGRLASKEITTKEQYVAACSNYGINSYPGAWDQWAIDVRLNPADAFVKEA